MRIQTQLEKSRKLNQPLLRNYHETILLVNYLFKKLMERIVDQTTHWDENGVIFKFFKVMEDKNKSLRGWI